VNHPTKSGRSRLMSKPAPGKTPDFAGTPVNHPTKSGRSRLMSKPAPGKTPDFAGTPAVALVTARAAHALDDDLPVLVTAFAAAGADAEIAEWDDHEVDWSRFDLALLRSTWDYTERLPQFLAWVERTAGLTLLLNPLPVVRWNSDKHYLRELSGWGVPVVPTTFVDAGSDARAALEEFLAHDNCAEMVVKPAVGAGSRDARRHARAATAEILAHLQPLLAAGRSMMLQPYLEGVDRDGETALVFIEGRFSHAIRKGPLLPAGAPSTAGLFAPEEITPRSPSADEIAVAARAVAQVPFGQLLYARVDLIRDATAQPRVLELELAEPSLFLAYAPQSAARFVSAALQRLRGVRALGGLGSNYVR
jgi:glutathione synthase/RimK-type ligase-like ATP-grasp enzyme